MKGLDATEGLLSKLERTMRFDAEFFSKRHLRIESLLKKVKRDSIASVCKISDGNHFSISDEFANEGVPYYRGQNVVGNVFIEHSSPNCITQRAYDVPYMRRSHLHKGDVLLSIIGTIGEASLVTSSKPATCSCKLAILRSHAVSPEYLAMVLRSEIGRSQTDRFTRGAVQMGLLLEDMDQLWIPRFSPKLEAAIVAAVAAAQLEYSTAINQLAVVELSLTVALSLGSWQPPEPLTYTRRASEVFDIERLDAEHFQPKYDATVAEAKRRGANTLPLSSLVHPLIAGVDSREFFEEGAPYIRVGDVKAGRIVKESAAKVPITVAETGKDIRIRSGDVVFTRKGSFGNAALVRPGDEDCVISTEIIRLRIADEWKLKLLPEYLTAYINSRLGKWQSEKWAHGAAFYSVSQDDLLKFVVLIPPLSGQLKIKDAVEKSEVARQHAHALLAAAQRAVEIAIENSEAAALAYLKDKS